MRTNSKCLYRQSQTSRFPISNLYAKIPAQEWCLSSHLTLMRPVKKHILLSVTLFPVPDVSPSLSHCVIRDLPSHTSHQSLCKVYKIHDVWISHNKIKQLFICSFPPCNAIKVCYSCNCFQGIHPNPQDTAAPSACYCGDLCSCDIMVKVTCVFMSRRQNINKF